MFPNKRLQSFLQSLTKPGNNAVKIFRSFGRKNLRCGPGFASNQAMVRDYSDPNWGSSVEYGHRTDKPEKPQLPASLIWILIGGELVLWLAVVAMARDLLGGSR